MASGGRAWGRRDALVVVAVVCFLSSEMPCLAGPSEDARAALNGKDYTTALRLWTPLANAGDAEAQTELGRLYDRGLGVQKDDLTALAWFRKAAEKGYARAQNAVGSFYASGRGVEKNDSEAVNWYRKAAEQGYAPAQANLGVRYMTGKGVTTDYDQGILWLTRATQRGNVRAKAQLGLASEQGHGVGKDAARAVALYNEVLNDLSKSPDEKLSKWVVAARERAVRQAQSSPQSNEPRYSNRAPSQPRVRSPSGGACEAGYGIDTVSEDGHIVKLDDGSIWEVHPVDRVTASMWLPTDDIVACETKLINTDESESVGALRLR